MPSNFADLHGGRAHSSRDGMDQHPPLVLVGHWMGSMASAVRPAFQ